MSSKTSKVIPLFKEEDILDVRTLCFRQSELGRIHQTIPWQELSDLLPTPKSSYSCGAKPWFDNAGKFATMFLKHYTNLSDEKLIERINTDWAMQEFCGIRLGINEGIKSKDIIGRIRGELAAHLDKLPEFQRIVAKEWFKNVKKEDLTTTGADASCYESHLRYPTDIKLLWECIEWLYEKQLFPICAALKINRPRNKFKEQKRKQLAYAKKKRTTPTERKVRLRALLHLVKKGLDQLEELFVQNPASLQHFSKKDIVVLDTVKKVLEQQQYMFDHNVRKVDNRIVSIFKPYLRPIVRGKENKKVEFGMKTHKIQIGGISFIEHNSFDAYNEGIRLKEVLNLHEELTGVRCEKAAFDQIYANNGNRKILTEKKILTNFSRKGKESTQLSEAEKKKIQKEKEQLGKQRATVLEGSFGNEKNHYGLKKIKARSAESEQIWVFFGIMTANAVKVSKLITKLEKEKRKQVA